MSARPTSWLKACICDVGEVHVDDTRVVMAIAVRTAAKQNAKQAAQ
jgi:hypothetical protein